MKKYRLCTVFVWFSLISCSEEGNLYVQSILRGPALVDDLEVIADDGNTYYPKRNPADSMQYSVTVPVLSEKFSLSCSPRNGGYVRYQYTKTEPRIGETDWDFTYTGEWTEWGEDCEAVFAPREPDLGHGDGDSGELADSEGKYLEITVVRIWVTEKYMDDGHYTVVVHRADNSILWDLTLEATDQYGSVSTLRSYPKYDRSFRYNMSEGPTKSLTGFPNKDQFFSCLPSPDAQSIRFSASMRADTCIQYALSDKAPAKARPALTYDVDPDDRVTPTKKFHHMKAVGTYSKSFDASSGWKGKYLYIRVWLAGDPYDPKGASDSEVRYEEYVMFLSERPSFQLVEYDSKKPNETAPPGTEFTLTDHYAGQPNKGYFEPESMLFFTIEPPLGLELTGVSFLIEKHDGTALETTTLSGITSATFSYVMPEYSPEYQYRSVKMHPLWDWATANNGEALRVRYVWENGADYVTEGAISEDMLAGSGEDKRVFGDGKSWGTAAFDLQAIIDNWDGSFDEIWLAGGTLAPYWRWALPDEEFAEGENPYSMPQWSWVVTKNQASGYDMSQPMCWTFLLRDGVSVYGGFAGTEDKKEDRVTEKYTEAGKKLVKYTNETILSGKFTDYGKPYTQESVNAMHVVTAQGLTSSAVTLEGVVIQDGWSGIQLPVFEICTRSYLSDYFGRQNWQGAGLSVTECAEGGVLNVENVIIRDNNAQSFGGVWIYKANPSFKKCLVTENKAAGAGFGGGIGIQGNPSFEDTVVTKNVAFYYEQGAFYVGGGGVLVCSGKGANVVADSRYIQAAAAAMPPSLSGSGLQEATFGYLETLGITLEGNLPDQAMVY